MTEADSYTERRAGSGARVAKQRTLAVSGSLDLSGKRLDKLPADHVTVGGDFNLSDSSITELPDHLTVGGDLNLSRTRVTKLPDNLKVAGKIYGFTRRLPAAPSGQGPDAVPVRRAPTGQARLDNCDHR
jgi:hypothetical protein